MINKQKIELLVGKAVSDLLPERGICISSIKIGTSNQITILIDNFEGISFSDCITISKSVEADLDREKEDFELTVSSAGISSPFTIPLQYQKNIGKEIEIYTVDNKKIRVILFNVEEEYIEIELKEKVKIDGKKKKQEKISKQKIMFDNIKTAKLVF